MHQLGSYHLAHPSATGGSRRTMHSHASYPGAGSKRSCQSTVVYLQFYLTYSTGAHARLCVVLIYHWTITAHLRLTVRLWPVCKSGSIDDPDEEDLVFVFLIRYYDNITWWKYETPRVPYDQYGTRLASYSINPCVYHWEQPTLGIKFNAVSLYITSIKLESLLKYADRIRKE